MVRSSQSVLVALAVLAVLGWSACDKNEQLPPTTLNTAKWITPQGGMLLTDGQGRMVSVSKAGIIALGDDGLPRATYHELNLSDWPEAVPVDACIDGDGRLYLATAKQLLLLVEEADPLADPGDRLVTSEAVNALVTGNRAVRSLRCNTVGDGVYLVTDFGIIAVTAGQTPGDSATWLVGDYKGTESALSARPYALDVDDAGVLWVLVYADETYTIQAILPGMLTNTGDDTVAVVPIGLTTKTGSALAADGDTGVWIINEGLVAHLSHQGTLADATDDQWTIFDDSDGATFTTLHPLSEGRVLALESTAASLWLADLGEDTLTEMPALGIDDGDNALTGLAATDEGLYYASSRDFGLLTLSGQGSSATWVRQRITDLSPFTGNDLSAALRLSDGMVLACPGGVSRVTYGGQDAPEAFSFSVHGLDNPLEASPFGINRLISLGDGYLAGGLAGMAYLSAQGQWTAWAEDGAPTDVVALGVGPGSFVFEGSAQTSMVTLVSINAYDYNATPETSADDEWSGIDTDAFGFAGGVAVYDFLFYDGCKALVGTASGLAMYDCMNTPDDSDDDLTQSNLLGSISPVKMIRAAGGNGYFIMAMDGLSYYNHNGTWETSDDTVVKYSLVKSPSTSFDLDDQGMLYYVAKGGLVIHDTKGTFADLSDDMVAQYASNENRDAVVARDPYGNLWYSFGDGSGVYYAAIQELFWWTLDELF